MANKFRFYAVKLSGVIILIFLAQVYINGFTDAFVLNELSFEQPWRFVSAIFLHGGLGHITLNLFALLLFGSILEKFIGGKRVLLVFFVTGIMANLISVNYYSSSLGASGAIFGVIGALVFVRPLLTVWAFGMPMPLFVAGFIWVLQDALGVFNPSGVGNIAHLSGMFFGLLFGIAYRRMIGKKSRKVNVSIDEDQIRRWEKKFME